MNNLDPGYVWSFMSMLIFLCTMPVILVVFYYLRNRFKNENSWMIISLVILFTMFFAHIGIVSWFSFEQELTAQERIIETSYDIGKEMLRFTIIAAFIAGGYFYSNKKSRSSGRA